MAVSAGDRSVRIASNATVLTIAGSDPSGGAGLQADLKTFQQLGCYGMSVVTLITAQNTRGVQAIHLLSPDLVRQQLNAVFEDLRPRTVKTGALGSPEIIDVVADTLRDLQLPMVVDPVLVSKHGDILADEGTVDAYREQLLPLATLLTPNRFEAERLLGRQLTGLQEMAQAAAELRQLGPDFVLLKSGEIDGKRHHLFASPEEVVGLELTNVDTTHTHGAGCCLSASIAARLALTFQGELSQAIMRSAIDCGIAAVHHAVEFAPRLGTQFGPVETRVLHVGS